MKIGLFGQFGSGNTGNDGSLEAMLQLLHRNCPGAQLICICQRPEIITEKFNLQAVSVGQPASNNIVFNTLNRALLQLPRRLLGFISAISLVHGLDLIIVPGTGILDDFNEDPFGWPFAILRWSLAAKLGGAHMAFVSIGAGPVEHPLSRFFVRIAASLAAYRSYRDQVSYDFMDSIKLDVSNDHVSADIAFSLPPATQELRDSPGENVGIGVMTYRGWRKRAVEGDAIYQNYLCKMIAIIEGLQRKGRQVRLLTGDTGDLEAARDLQRLLNKHDYRDVIFEPVQSLHDVMQQIAKTDIVIASRYHNIVCALSMGRPAISLGYAKKNDALLKDTDLSEFSHHIETFNPQLLLSQVDSMFERKAELGESVKAGVTQYRKRLARQEDAINKELLSKIDPDKMIKR
ncbi:polysaccharide pyruvyl transferase family protein [Brucella sp. H1_1004]|uniref:polysaccharide pyruvyl transferase family protein n=1 Tax=Brucella sp. H1_1004 TaxID=3110109 RepID=UPI0039B4D827